MATLKAPLRLSRPLYPKGSMLCASHPGGMESAWLSVATPTAATATAHMAAHWRYFIARIRFPQAAVDGGCDDRPAFAGSSFPFSYRRSMRSLRVQHEVGRIHFIEHQKGPLSVARRRKR